MKDIAGMFDYCRLKKVTKYTLWESHKKKSETKKFIQKTLNNYIKGFPAPWAIVLRRNNKLIGSAEIGGYSAAHKMASLGYVLSPDYWNKGYTTEAVKKMIQFGFNKLKLNRIEAMCDVANKASARVVEKSGMKFDGILKKRAISPGNRVRDVRIYAITKRDHK